MRTLKKIHLVESWLFFLQIPGNCYQQGLKASQGGYTILLVGGNQGLGWAWLFGQGNLPLMPWFGKCLGGYMYKNIFSKKNEVYEDVLTRSVPMTCSHPGENLAFPPFKPFTGLNIYL